ncbi:MerR family transcriptional regulator [Siminovitchia fortis]|uniref:MerR family transcriptional regulator n=1 Tax=Siminovitchia fortis TaxID=254758 RepID=A0A443IQQ8_9BACI|nr:MerR family transcriptional regulator [Siminovitchia fortis]RWR09296.1 MerR family transcriptional regulator [Siminovitchia fortis]WHY80909.1 MerR family transcriptional regulator [Siminovitchia fortis]
MESNEPMFTIGEFGRRARITVRTLRFYEELGLLVPSRKNSSGHRLYGLAELAKLQQIQSLKFLGYSLQEIKNLIGNDTNAFNQLEKSLPLQHKLLTKKRDELNRAIEAVEHVQRLMNEEKLVTWPVLSSLLFQIEHEEDQKEWVKEYFSDDETANQFFSLSKKHRQQLDAEMLEWLASLKKLMKEGASPQSPEAFDILIKLTEMATRHVDDKEELAEQLEKAQELMESDVINFQFPTFLTPEEESFIEEIGKGMEALYNQNNKIGND